MRNIFLTKGYMTYVDDDDFDWLNQWVWSAQVAKNGRVYAYRRPYDRETGKQGKVYMHRAIMCPRDGVDIDHKNANTLDNRRENLRIASRNQNNGNMRRRADNTSGQKGVYWDKARKKWVARLHFNGVKLCKRFGTFDEAKRAYEIAAAEFFGEFARLS